MVLRYLGRDSRVCRTDAQQNVYSNLSDFSNKPPTSNSNHFYETRILSLKHHSELNLCNSKNMRVNLKANCEEDTRRPSCFYQERPSYTRWRPSCFRLGRKTFFNEFVPVLILLIVCRAIATDDSEYIFVVYILFLCIYNFIYFKTGMVRSMKWVPGMLDMEKLGADLRLIIQRHKVQTSLFVKNICKIMFSLENCTDLHGKSWIRYCKFFDICPKTYLSDRVS